MLNEARCDYVSTDPVSVGRRLPKTTKFPAAKQRILDQLLEKNSAGTINSNERVRLEQLVGEAERLMVANAKNLARFAQSESAGAPVGAVPVTVWVKPERSE